MRVLVIGQGGREHALVWKLGQSPSATKVYCAPGNAGTAQDAKNVVVDDSDPRDVVRFCKRESIDLVVVGPEIPLVAGISDVLRKEQINVFGPSKAAAELEGSKIACKMVLRRAKAPTANYRVFDRIEEAERYFAERPEACVVKADGLAAGKGVIVCNGGIAGRAAARRMLVDGEFGRAGETILVEERLEGTELSVLALTDGSTLVTLPPCQDYKRALDGDQGPNTGGMGAICPSPNVTPELLAQIERDILVPVLHTMKSERRPFQGILYAGIMLTQKGPKVLEFNVRFGDPECQPLLMRLKSDLAQVLMAAAVGKLKTVELEWDPRPAVCIVMASGGYPGTFKKGVPIRGLDNVTGIPDVKVFHAGTKKDIDRIVTTGGRVLGVTALGDTMEAARTSAYQAIESIRFTDMQYRRDIAASGEPKSTDSAPTVEPPAEAT